MEIVVIYVFLHFTTILFDASVKIISYWMLTMENVYVSCFKKRNQIFEKNYSYLLALEIISAVFPLKLPKFIVFFFMNMENRY